MVGRGGSYEDRHDREEERNAEPRAKYGDQGTRRSG